MVAEGPLRRGSADGYVRSFNLGSATQVHTDIRPPTVKELLGIDQRRVRVHEQANEALTFPGICILTSNHESAIDEAFRRRLSLHVRFPLPEATERQRLWQALLPAAAPVDGDLELESLAQNYVMSGGYIKNAVLRAAFLAADQGRAITGGLLARAAQLELEAMGRVVTRAG